MEQLLAEVQKKSRIIQAYALSTEPGALISEQSDIHKVQPVICRCISFSRDRLSFITT